MDSYQRQISQLISSLPFEIDTDIKIEGKPPTMASSEFLTNKEQGDWAEQIVLNAINENSKEYCAVKYGRSDSLAAGDEGFEQFYTSYQNELNTIGKRPDILIFQSNNFNHNFDPNNPEHIGKAIAAIEVRSSSFLSNQYDKYMESRTKTALEECNRLRNQLLESPLNQILQQKSPEIFDLILNASENTFRELDFRRRSWCTSPELKTISQILQSLKEQIKILHKRDYLSITPKMEDLSLVNRWIQRFNIPHFYLQVFFDKAYIIPFKEILEITSDPSKEEVFFSIEEDVKNQGKTTIKINIKAGQEILGKIDMPNHRSQMKKMQRGRLLFYVTFNGGKGYLDHNTFIKKVIQQS